MIDYKTYKKLENKGLAEIQVSADKSRSLINKDMSDDYHRSVVANSVISILILILAVPIYLALGWIGAAVVILIGLLFYYLMAGRNYRVFVKAKAEEDKAFFDKCQGAGIIVVVTKN